MPTTPKTLGDFIRLGRFTKGIKLSEIAANTGVPIAQVEQWELDVCEPKESHLRVLESMLGIQLE